MTNLIKIHSQKDFFHMRNAGKLAAKCLDHITDFIKPGISTEEINKICHEFQLENNAIPAPLNYKGSPKSVCTSINHVVGPGIPSKKKLKEIKLFNDQLFFL